MTAKLHVVPGPTGAPWAVLGEPTAADTPSDTTWSGRMESFEAFFLGGKLLPPDAIFCAELTKRWRRLVVCRPAFADWFQSVADAPSGFVLEVLS